MITSINISQKQYFNWQECLWYLDRGFDDCVYQVRPGCVRRAFEFEGEAVLVDISYANGALTLQWLIGTKSTATINHVHQFVADWFDLETDLTPFYKLLLANQPLAYMAQSFKGLRFVGMPDIFESLAWGIIGQQINLSFAYKLKRRLVETYGTSLLYGDGKYWIFPTPAKLSGLQPDDLRQLQFSQKKAEYLITVAKQFADNALSKNIVLALPDFLSRQKILTSIRGIGVWTANYVLMKSLKERSSIPYGDAGILKALILHGFMKDKTDLQGMDSFYKTFAGWESYLSFYLWRSLANKPEEQETSVMPPSL
ncbi:DNA-3-methyladenine glycosylase family protein [Mucilaginibacter flavus]|uniref:DNA-3-methyladenine glycosylase family protein n=1 Tax=Mucilaginibacter flavus TaxID=931504 RepID=UPI0025B396E7|nr:DNA glycosylase [Mucilaginibacter flavus]MDN3581841.1 DNA repair protein [Mucilaginibacter flavus]